MIVITMATKDWNLRDRLVSVYSRGNMPVEKENFRLGKNKFQLGSSVL